jgi:ribosome biogenesis GTPase
MCKQEEGLVMKSTGSSYLVRDKLNGQILVCRLQGKFRLAKFKTTNPIATGDVVSFSKNDNDDYGIITSIHKRKNYIDRKSVNLSKISHIIAANIDRVFLIINLVEPQTPLGFIDRFLVSAESFRINTVLVFHKTDIYTPEIQKQEKQLQSLYSDIGYQCVSTSVVTSQGLEQLKKLMQNNISLFGGQSGAGKSSIINALNPDFALKTASVSQYNNKGKHTTTFAEMFELPFGGFIIDTPGMKEFGLIHYTKEEISHYFPEMLRLLSACRFRNCTHTHEPHCAVKQALDAGEIALSRYQNYLGIINNEDADLKDWMLS